MMARPRKVIDARQLEELASIGCTTGEMAGVLGCCTRTLQTRYCAAMKKGRLRGNAALRQMQYDVAIAGDRTMLVWLGKQYLGQTDRQRVENIDLSSATDEELERIASGVGRHLRLAVDSG